MIYRSSKHRLEDVFGRTRRPAARGRPRDETRPGRAISPPRDRRDGSRDRRDRRDRDRSRSRDRGDGPRGGRRRDRRDRRSSRSRSRSPRRRDRRETSAERADREAIRERRREEREMERKRRELERLERDARTVFAYNLSTKADEREIFQFFSAAGTVNDVRIIYDRNTPTSKGMAYVEFAEESAVEPALACTGKILRNQVVMVKASEAEKNAAWKMEREAKKKTSRGNGGERRRPRPSRRRTGEGDDGTGEGDERHHGDGWCCDFRSSRGTRADPHPSASASRRRRAVAPAAAAVVRAQRGQRASRRRRGGLARGLRALRDARARLRGPEAHPGRRMRLRDGAVRERAARGAGARAAQRASSSSGAPWLFPWRRRRTFPTPRTRDRVRT